MEDLPQIPGMKRRAWRYALRIAAIYFGVSALWVVTSDNVITDIVDQIPHLSAIQTYKGLIFVLVTSLLIYVLVHRYLARQEVVVEQLHASEARYRHLYDDNPVPMWVYDIETLRFLAVNEAAIDQYGYSREEFMAMTILDIRPPEDWERLQKNIAAVTSGLDRAGIWKHLKKDGSLIHVEIASHTITFDERRAELVLAHDITERQRAEAELLRTQETLKLALAAAGIGTWEVDLTTQEHNLTWSEGYGRLYGLTPEELPRNGSQFFERVHPDDHDIIRQRIEHSIREDLRYECEFRIFLPNGDIHWHLALGRALRDQNGKAVRFLGVGRDITGRKRMEERMQVQLKQMESLHEIEVSIASTLDVTLTLNILAQAVVRHLGVSAADILLLKLAGNTLDFACGQGFLTDSLKSWRVKLGEGYAGRVALERQRLYVPNLTEAGEDFMRARLLSGEGFTAYVGVPLIAKGQLKGVLEVFHRDPLTPDDGWFRFLETAGRQAAVAIDNSQIFEQLQRTNADLSLAYEATIEGWSRAMDMRDKETEGHTQRVTELSLRLGRAMRMSEDQLVHLRRGALLHDMGKLGVPDQVLLKPDKLTDDEWAIMRQHPQIAFDMLSAIEYLRPALDVPYCHHEKWDGTGYPRGLKGTQIPIAARIFSVVDVWDALRSDRPYRPAWSEERTMEYIQSLSGKDFDPKVVDEFMKCIVG